jgi:CHAT domain-containing protein/tetratricopeptide (TPR) repeat protein
LVSLLLASFWRVKEQRQKLERQALGLLQASAGAVQGGDVGTAIELNTRSLELYERLYPTRDYPEGHPALAAGLNKLGPLLHAQGDYGGARGCLERALAMNEALYPRDRYPHGHRDLAASLSYLGRLIQAQGDYGGARGYFERALAMNEALYPRDPLEDPLDHAHHDLTQSLNNLGYLLQDQGDYGGARRYHERALAMTEARYPKEWFPNGTAELAKSLNTLGLLLRAQGDFGGARRYHERALAIYEARYPEGRFPSGDPDLAESLSHLGGLLTAQGDYGGARRHYERALAMTEALCPKDRFPNGHTKLAESLTHLGGVLLAQRDYGGALGYGKRALAMYEALYPMDGCPHGHPKLAASLNDLGYLHRARGDYRGARRYYAQALAMNQALYPNNGYPHGHPKLAASLHNLGLMFEQEGQLAAAFPLFQRAVDMYHDQAELVQAGLSEAESLDYLDSLPGAIDHFLSVSCRVAGQADATYARVWRNKAAVARVIERRQAALTIWAGADAGIRQRLESWRDVRRQFARLLLETSDGREDSGRVERLQRLTADKERLERTLAAAIPEFAREQALMRSQHTRLIELLPEHTVVLDLVAFDRSEQDPKVDGDQGQGFTPSYVGFVLAKGQPVRQVELGPAQPVDEAVRDWLEAIEQRRVSLAAELFVRRAVWEPLARLLPAGTRTVLIAPDSDLTTLPWGALPGDPPGTVLLEQYALATIPHAPFLLDRLTAPAPAQRRGDLVLAVGGVDYDGIPEPLGDPAARTDLLALRRAETERGRGPGGDGWRDLPGTAREVEAVAKQAGRRSLLRLHGTEASTARLLTELPRARWAHIATHGFFADPDVRSILQPDPRLFAFEGRQRAAAGLRNPLVLSGLVLAGANRLPAAVAKADQAGDDLGIVTAEAIAGLPLHDLELVVLSACETGLGLVGGGEGVFGLQRAFHLAGAQNVVASLWKVDDEATAALMAFFYDQLWRQDKPPIEALRAAQLALYRRPELAGKLARARGTPDFDKLVRRPEPAPGGGGPGPRRADPKDWAAFVLSGWGR